MAALSLRLAITEKINLLKFHAYNVMSFTDHLFTTRRKPNILTLISVTFTISLILVLMVGLLMGFLLAKCCLKPFKKSKKKVSQMVDLSAPIYEQIIYTGHIMDKNSIELEGNVAYGPIQPKLSA